MNPTEATTALPAVRPVIQLGGGPELRAMQDRSDAFLAARLRARAVRRNTRAGTRMVSLDFVI